MRDIIRKVLLENESQKQREFAKRALFKLWDKQKSKNIKPQVNSVLAKSFGLNNTGILEDWVVEWYGGEDVVFSNIKKELVNKVLTTDDVENYGIGVGGYDFSFKIFDIDFGKTKHGGLSVGVLFDIIQGSVTLMTTGEEYDLNDHKNISDDLWFELDNEIKDIISDLIRYVSKSFGIYDIEGIYLDWN